MVIQIDLLLDLGWVWWTTTNLQIRVGSRRKINFSRQDLQFDGVKMYTSTPNANSLVAHRGSKRGVRDGEGLSTLKTRGEIYPTCNQELEGV